MSRKNDIPIILASASPKRRELLEQLGISFRVVVSDCLEDMSQTKNPHKLVRILSREKARCVAGEHPNAIVIGADTFGVLGKKFLGKPENEKEAATMIRQLGGRMHLAITGLTIIDTRKKKERSYVATTKVWFRKVSPAEIAWYIQSGEWKGKAAAYTVLSRAGAFIERIEGELGTILGLPLATLTNALSKDFGIKLPTISRF